MANGFVAFREKGVGREGVEGVRRKEGVGRPRFGLRDLIGWWVRRWGVDDRYSVLARGKAIPEETRARACMRALYTPMYQNQISQTLLQYASN
jgi:hypothetical protein